MVQPTRSKLRVGCRLGKYRLLSRISEGGFARVYKAQDTIEGVKVALKIPHTEVVSKKTMTWFRQEAKVNAALDHPNVLPVKNAEMIDGHFVIAYPLGKRSLADRLRSRVSTAVLYDYMEQMLDAVAHAHEHGIVHCDLKPDNFILFDDNRVRLGDFGVARIARRTVRGSGSGTFGFIAPEHAMGHTSFRADVFTLGLIFWMMLTGELPEWPFAWPPPGHDRLRGRVHPDLLALLRRAMETEPKKRFADGRQMLAAFRKLKPRLRRHMLGQRRRRNGTPQTRTRHDWQQVRFRNFVRTYNKVLQVDRVCGHCEGPVGETMHGCPWCGEELHFDAHDTAFPAACGRCHRGRKLDWRFCAWCYGKGFDTVSDRAYADKRYAGACGACDHPLMPFMRYCPGCRAKLDHKWLLPGSDEACERCEWGVVREYWDHCPWCRSGLQRH